MKNLSLLLVFVFTVQLASAVRYNFSDHINIHARYLHPVTAIGTFELTDFNGTVLRPSILHSRTLSLAVGYTF